MTNLLTTAFRFALQSTKHPAFLEEREWRIIYSPFFAPQNGEELEKHRKRVPMTTMVIRGVPQRVYSIPFANYPEDGLTGATVPELLDRVLIGPSQDGDAIAQAYADRLSELGIDKPHLKVIQTHIPLRQ
ncbi:hypothetical protein [Bordetella hinzii]|uniref:hypothetical protein n=1 Tax=Bordetella hinzii TaxID=103855 RepID=UPI0011539540|nr:hypothetical protein [Bordetella hinzii]